MTAIQQAVDAGMNAIGPNLKADAPREDDISCIPKGERSRHQCCIIINGIPCKGVTTTKSNTCCEKHRLLRVAWDNKMLLQDRLQDKPWTKRGPTNRLKKQLAKKAKKTQSNKSPKTVHWSPSIQENVSPNVPTNKPFPEEKYVDSTTNFPMVCAQPQKSTIHDQVKLICENFQHSIVNAVKTADRKRKQRENNMKDEMQNLQKTIDLGDQDCKALTITLKATIDGWNEAKQQVARMEAQLSLAQEESKKLQDAILKKHTTQVETTVLTEFAKVDYWWRNAEKQLGQCRNELTLSQELWKDSQEQLKQAQEHWKQSQEQWKYTQEELKQSEEQRTQLQEQLKQSQAQMAQYQQDWETMNAERIVMMEELTKCKEESTKYKEELTKYKLQLQATQEQMAHLKTASATELNKYKQQFNNAKHLFATSQQKVHELQQLFNQSNNKKCWACNEGFHPGKKCSPNGAALEKSSTTLIACSPMLVTLLSETNQ